MKLKEGGPSVVQLMAPSFQVSFSIFNFQILSFLILNNPERCILKKYNSGGKIGSANETPDEEGFRETLPVDDVKAVCQDALRE